MPYVLGTAGLVALLLAFVLCLRSWKATVDLLLREITRSNDQESVTSKELVRTTQSLINLSDDSSKRHEAQVTDLINRLASHNWQEYLILQERTSPGVEQSSVEHVFEEDEEDTQVIANLFDDVTEEHWNQVNG